MAVGVALDSESPAQLARYAYKYVDCGPSVCVLVRNPGGGGAMLWGSALRDLGTWSEMRKEGFLVIGLQVSSIIEGSDAVVPPIIVHASPIASLGKRYYAALDAVNAAAGSIFDSLDADGGIE
jgi:hypothetical protein